MADNYLEYHREDYERRKAQWLAKQKKATLQRKELITQQQAKHLLLL